MSWRDRLVGDDVGMASFRGAPFSVRSHEYQSGRRVQDHQFPNREVNYAEDLGRATASFRVVGFVVGEDYDLARNRLIKALNEPGPGILSHPWLGRINVSAREFTVREDAESQRMCTVEMAFIEAGAALYPSEGPDESGFLQGLATETRVAADSMLDRYYRAARLPQAAVGRVRGVVQGVGEAVDRASLVGVATARASNDLALAVRGLASDATSVVQAPALLKARLGAAFDGLAAAVADAGDRFRAFSTIARGDSPSPGRFATSWRRDEYTSAWSVDAWAKSVAAAQAAAAASEIPFRSRAAADEVREAVAGAAEGVLGDEALVDGAVVGPTPELAAALSDLAAAARRRFPEFNRADPRETAVDVGRTTNAITIVHQATGGIEALEATIEENAIADPLAVLPGRVTVVQGAAA